MNNPFDTQLLERCRRGLPLVTRPYAAWAKELGVDEAAVIGRLKELTASGALKRWGVVLHHRALGYRANGMVVWDIPKQRLDDVGALFSQFPFVTLCYERPRIPGKWPYNLFTMIHGKNRDTVLAQAAQLCLAAELGEGDYQILFSKRCFKQRGAALLKPQEALP